MGVTATRTLAYVAMTRGRHTNDAYLYERFRGELDHEHTSPTGTDDIHILKRGTPNHAAQAFYTLMRTNDDRPITMHALAVKTDTEHLPAARRITASRTHPAARPTARPLHRMATRTATPRHRTRPAAADGPNGASPGRSNATMPAWSSSRPAATLTVTAMSREQPDAPIPIDSWRNRHRIRRPKAAGLFTIEEVGDACGLPQDIGAMGALWPNAVGGGGSVPGEGAPGFSRPLSLRRTPQPS